MNRNFVEELMKLMQENPELPVMCQVDSDIVADDGYGWWLGMLNEKWSPEIREYSTDIQECVCFKDDDEYTDWMESLFDIDDFVDVPDNEWEEFCKTKVDEVANWKKAIFIAITVY